MGNLQPLLWTTISRAYGLLNLLIYCTYAALHGEFFSRPTPKAKEALSHARSKLWSFNGAPTVQGPLNHEFFTLKDGNKLHYLASDLSNDLENTDHLTIFLHGFPDSCHLWQHFLRVPRLKEHSLMLAVDLPGYGGSDGLSDYGAEEVLEAMTAFVVAMRERYLSKDGKVLIVSHDWGALIAFRLASEAPQLADRFVVSNTLLPSLAISNIKMRLQSATQMYHTWKHRPRSLPLLRKALSTLRPVLSQLRKSGYIFLFNLPPPLSTWFGSFGNYWFLRTLHRIAARQHLPLEATRAAEALASSLGPGVGECKEYPASVQQRAVSGAWAQQIRLYREGLAYDPWDKSLETLVALNEIDGNRQVTALRSPSGAGLFDSGPEGALRAPVTCVWGMQDRALDYTIAVEGMGDYLSKGSQVIALPKCGHWVPVEEVGQKVFEEVVEWAVRGEKGDLKKRVGDVAPGARFTIER